MLNFENKHNINKFLSKINDDNFRLIINLILDKYPYNYNKEYIDKFITILNRIYNDYDAELIFREMKDLITDCLYNRCNKKFKFDLINSKLYDESKIEILFNCLNIYLLSNKFELIIENQSTIKYFEIESKLGISDSNNNFFEEVNEKYKEDFKKNEIYLNLNISSQKIEPKSLIKIKLNKRKFEDLFEELEKLQEKIDELK